MLSPEAAGVTRLVSPLSKHETAPGAGALLASPGSAPPLSAWPPVRGGWPWPRPPTREMEAKAEAQAEAEAEAEAWGQHHQSLEAEAQAQAHTEAEP